MDTPRPARKLFMALFFAYRTPSLPFQRDALQYAADKFISAAIRIATSMSDGTDALYEDLNSYQSDLHNYLVNYYACQRIAQAGSAPVNQYDIAG